MSNSEDNNTPTEASDDAPEQQPSSDPQPEQGEQADEVSDSPERAEETSEAPTDDADETSAPVDDEPATDDEKPAATDDGEAESASDDGGDEKGQPDPPPSVPAESRPPDRQTSEPEPFEEDGRADQALDFVVDVLTSMGMDCTVDLMENDDDDPPEDIRIEINGRDADRLIGKKGQTLAALQFLTNRVINRPNKPRRHIIIDAGGYRARRESALSSMAQRLGKQAVDEGKIITFEPMSAQDRRVVHLALAKFPGVVTKSEGRGSTRRVQIIPVREDG